jgi:hypothetical protein
LPRVRRSPRAVGRLPADAAERQARRFEHERQRQQIDHVVVDHEEQLLREHCGEHARRAEPRVRDEGPQHPFGHLRGPDEREEVDDRAEPVAERAAHERVDDVGRGVERDEDGEEVARREEGEAQRALALKDVIVEHVVRRVGQRDARGVDEREREQDERPEGCGRPTLVALRFRDDVAEPRAERDDDGRGPRRAVVRDDPRVLAHDRDEVEQ